MKNTLRNFSLGGLVLLFILVFFHQGMSQTVILTENWETASIGQTPPAGWTIDLVSGNNYTFFLQNGTLPSCYPYNGNRMVEFRSYDAMSGTSNRLKRTTPVQTTGFVTVSVDFEWYTNTDYYWSNDNVAIQWSTNGTDWVTAATIPRYASTTGWQYEAVALPAGAANQPALFIAFLFSSSNGENCHLDLVHVNGYSTTPLAPTVTTNPPIWVGAKYAYLAGVVNANGNPTSAYFQYGLTASYGSSVSGATVNGNTPVAINGYPYTLMPSHLYHYRAVGSNVGGTTYGNDLTFTTADTVPEVFTQTATDLGSTSATVHGAVYPNGSTTTVTFSYGITSGYGSTANGNPATVSGDSTMGYTSATLTGLTPNTTYHYRIAGVNAGGTGYGMDTVFTTTGTQPPTAITTYATSISANGATLNGNVNANGTSTNVTFQYGLTPAYGSTVTYGAVNGNNLIPVSKNITGLSPATTYHFRVVGSSSAGTIYGYDTVFTTSPSGSTLPTVITTGATYFTASNAVLRGDVNANGFATIASFQYGLTTAYGSEVTYGNVYGNNMNAVSAQAFGLYPATTYHYRAVGTNAGGTAYGHDTTFTTSDSTGCVAIMTYEDAGPLTIQFQDASIAGMHERWWHFGDQTYSQEANPVHTYPAAGDYQVILRIIGDSLSYCNDSTIQIIHVGDSTISCQAHFAYATDSLDPNTVHFTDQSTGTITSRDWQFGDGTSSTLTDPTHTFAVPGTYHVCLTVYGPGCQHRFCQEVTIASPLNHHLFGQVFAGGIPVQSGIVNLFSVDTIPPYNPYLDISFVDSAGTYSFIQVPDGDYYINAIPAGVPGYLPTFYGDVLYWEEATIIHLGAPANPYNINLIDALSMPSGNGSIGGQINTSGLKSTFVEKITMILMNSGGQPISYDCIKQGGIFSFASLAYGTYYLKAEMAGITSELIKVVISQEHPDASLTMTFSGNNISGTRDFMQGINSWRVFPNPVTDHVSVSLDMNREVQVVAEIHNLTGQLVSENTVKLHSGSNVISIPTASLPMGLYTLRLYSKEGMNIYTKLVKTR